MKVAIAIVAHKDRAKQVDRLVDWVDPDYVSWDDGTLGPAENHLRAWENLAEEDAEVCLVLEDDAVPVANFRSELSRVLAVAPTDLVSLYLGKGRPPHWQPTLAKVFGSLDRRLYPNAPDPSWLIADEVLHGVALAMKPSLIADMLPVVRRSTQPRRRHRLPVDEAIGAWARSAGIRVSYSLPSIVQHGDLPTLITEHTTGHSGDTGIRDQPRRAWAMGTRRRWDGTSVEAPAPAPVTRPLSSIKR